ncbi:MAG TPA: penicillin-binding transpeptidase domain-containing protein [Solirubrobacterales bacterium]|nr:penicillin-binding transpeptidase domain-containing protein [Solirubrobacterales bacterium]
MSPTSTQAARRRRLLTRALPIAFLGLVAFAAGLIVGAAHTNVAGVQRFADDWERGDFAGMYAELGSASASHYTLAQFTSDYDNAERTATVKSLSTGDVSEDEAGGRRVAVVPVTLDTNAFGQIAGNLTVPLDGDSVDWAPNLVFPGLAPKERLVRRTRVPTRASILARDGTPLAEGPATARSSPLGAAAVNVAGEVSTPKAPENRELMRLGFPPAAPTGTSGLELAFNRRLAGRPGGELVAVGNRASRPSVGGRIIVSSDPVPGKPVHTTIDPDLQRSAAVALGGQYGGVAVLDAKTGAVLALAGIAFSGPQPPGSTFKVITTTAALDAGVVKLSDQFPITTSTVVDGREIDNANMEACGGSFVQAFAESCNAVFAPLGPKIGSQRLVDTAERFGFNSPLTLFDEGAVRALHAPESTIPSTIPSDLDLAVSAIGQGKVLATPFEMASVAQTIANRGTRSPNEMVTDRALRSSAGPVQVTSPEIASTLRSLMIGVVQNGTGTAAALPGIQVAGKTGTAELGPNPTGSAGAAQQIDAWFTAFAPASAPKLVAAAMVVNASGDGGTVAAPIVRQVLATGLGVG